MTSRRPVLALCGLLALGGCGANQLMKASSHHDLPGAVTTSPLTLGVAPVPPVEHCTRTQQSRSLTFTAGGATRTAQISLPAADDLRHPLVVALHGDGQTVKQFDDKTGLRHAGSLAGAIVAEPAALGMPTRWNVTDSAGVSDVLMVRALVSLLVDTACADPREVVLTGSSAGADLAVTTTCSSPGTAAALLLVAASTGPAPGCRHQAVVAVRGTRDTVVPYATAEPEFTAWTTLDRCTTHTESMGGTLRRLTGEGCTDPVQLIAVQGAGHGWPEGQDLDTTDLLRTVLAVVAR